MSELLNEKTGSVWGVRLLAITFLLFGLALGYFTYSSEVRPDSRFPFRLGLDLAGGAHLIYRADVADVAPQEIPEALEALREVIERRVSSRDIAGVTGVLDPSVQISESSVLSGEKEYRLIVELPGVSDVEKAKAVIGVTPLLEFKLLGPELDLTLVDGSTTTRRSFIPTALTGRYLNRAHLEFTGQGAGGLAGQPQIILEFNEAGARLFGELTRENVGKTLAIFLDGESIEEPVIREEIPNGTAVITGAFTPIEAREVVRNLNLGALPVPIEAVSTQTIGPSLGAETLRQGVWAGLWGLLAVGLFMILWYRLPGFFAVLALAIYVVLNLAIFKLIPVTLTAAGIAGFILSIGMAVDANILIFSRMREELQAGKRLPQAVREGFSRAWLSIRDGNVTSILSGIIIFYAGTFLTKGFAVTLFIGILTSMFTALTVTRTLLLAAGEWLGPKAARLLYGHGMRL